MTTQNKKTAGKKANTATAANVNGADIITAENVQTIAERIAVKALKTCLTSGGKPTESKPTNGGNFNFLYSLYCGLIADITERKRTGAPLSDGYDIAQTATVFLCGYIGKKLHDCADNGETDKDGKPIDILRATFRAVNRYIMGERQREYKRAYVDETDENGKTIYYEIPDEWDAPTVADYKGISDLIARLDLPQRQLQVLKYRLRGIAVDDGDATRRKGQATPAADSLQTIARKMGISRQAVQNLMRKIQAKSIAIGLKPENTTANE